MCTELVQVDHGVEQIKPGLVPTLIFRNASEAPFARQEKLYLWNTAELALPAARAETDQQAQTILTCSATSFDKDLPHGADPYSHQIPTQ